LKKLGALIVVLAVLFVVNSNSFAQPRLVIHVTGGYSLPLPDLKGTFPDDNTKNPIPLMMKNGWNVGADGKFYVDKKLRSFGITLSLAYMGFSTGDLDTGTAMFSGKFNSFTAGLGVEYKFLTKKKAQPFVGAEFTGNFLSGKRTPTTGTETTLKATSRFGLSFGAGVDIAFSKNVGAVIGGKYALMNLIGKKDTSETATGTEYPLWDKEYGTVNALNLSYLQIYAGVSFYLMQPKAKMKK
jgi:Outer membrane protein beta-barrel domain